MIALTVLVLISMQVFASEKTTAKRSVAQVIIGCTQEAIGAAAGFAMAKSVPSSNYIEKRVDFSFSIFDLSIVDNPEELASHAITRFRIQLIPKGSVKRTFYVDAGDNCRVWNTFEAAN